MRGTVTTKTAFRQADLQRAVKAVQAAGLPVTAIEIAPDGTIRILTSEPRLPSRLSSSGKQIRPGEAPSLRPGAPHGE